MNAWSEMCQKHVHREWWRPPRATRQRWTECAREIEKAQEERQLLFFFIILENTVPAQKTSQGKKKYTRHTQKTKQHDVKHIQTTRKQNISCLVIGQEQSRLTIAKSRRGQPQMCWWGLGMIWAFFREWFSNNNLVKSIRNNQTESI